jgi:hypothetical protein
MTNQPPKAVETKRYLPRRALAFATFVALAAGCGAGLDGTSATEEIPGASEALQVDRPPTSPALVAAAPGEIDLRPDGCHYIVPNGSVVYAASGEVYLGETFVGNFHTACDAAVSGQAPTEASPGSGADDLSDHKCSAIGAACGSGCCSSLHCDWNNTCMANPGYVTEEWATAISNANTQPKFSYQSATWTVPAAPTKVGDVGTELLWNGFQSPGPNGGYQIIQPELWFFGNLNQWQNYSQFGQIVTKGGNEYFANSQSFKANKGDTIEGVMYITTDASQDGQQGDEWYISSFDTTTGNNSYFYVYTGQCGVKGQDTCGDNYPFTSVNAAVLEVQGLAACDGLPNVKSVNFTVTALGQCEAAGSSSHPCDASVQWYSVLDSLTWQPTNFTNTTPPNCSYSSSISEGKNTDTVTMNWSP